MRHRGERLILDAKYDYMYAACIMPIDAYVYSALTPILFAAVEVLPGLLGISVGLDESSQHLQVSGSLYPSIHYPVIMIERRNSKSIKNQSRF